MRLRSSAASGSSISSRRGLVSSARAMPTLALTRQRTRQALQQVLDAEQFHHMVPVHPALVGLDPAQAVFQVAPCREVWEQAGFLEHITQGALVRRDEQPARTVLPAFAVDFQVRLAGALQAGDAAQAGGLARANGRTAPSRRGQAGRGRRPVRSRARPGGSGRGSARRLVSRSCTNPFN